MSYLLMAIYLAWFVGNAKHVIFAQKKFIYFSESLTQTHFRVSIRGEVAVVHRFLSVVLTSHAPSLQVSDAWCIQKSWLIQY